MVLRRQWTWIVWIALLGIICLAAGLRFWQLDTLPPGLYHDEAYNGLDALSLLAGKTFPQFYEGWELYAQDAHAERPPTPTRFPVFFEGNYGREPLHIYLMELSIWLLGPTPFAIRAVPAAAGVLAVLTTYLAAWALFDVWRPTGGNNRLDPKLVALFAALALAILYPAIHFSRFGIRPMVFVPLETLAVFCFWRGVKEETRRLRDWETRGLGTAKSLLVSQSPSLLFWFTAAGFCIGLALYTYASARLFPLLFVLIAAYWWWQDRNGFRGMFRYWVVMGVVAVVTAAPLLLFFIRYPYFFVFRIAYVANRGAGVVEDAPVVTWLLNVGRVFRGLFWQGETHLRHNLPGRPYLDPIQALLFVVGVGNALRRWRQPAAVFLLLWLVVLLLPTILSGDAPHFGRMIGVAPVVAILIGWAGVWLIEWAAKFMKGRGRTRMNADGVPSKVALLFVVLLFGLSLFWAGRDYFGRYASHPDLARDFYQPDWELGRYAAALPEETTIYFTPTQEEMATIFFAFSDPQRIRSYDGSMGLIPAGEVGVPVVYLVRPQATAHQAYLQDFFPDGKVQATEDNFVAFAIPADAPRLTGASEAPAVSWDDLISLVDWSLVQQAERLEVTLYWQALRPMETSYTAFVHLLDETGTLVAQRDRPPAGYPTAVWRPGEVVVDTFVIELPPDLPPGTYRLQTGFYDPLTVARVGEAAEMGYIEQAE